ncbi:hypothetical protein FOZ63_008960, partial [Perkinsus olseni]
MDLEVEGLCAAVFKAVKKKFPNFKDLCTEYHDESEAAVRGIPVVSREEIGEQQFHISGVIRACVLLSKYMPIFSGRIHEFREFNGKPETELRSELDILVMGSMVQTQSVTCPKDQAHGNAFKTTYWGNPSLATYQSDYPKSHPLHDFGAAGPPDSTGLNPLRKVDQPSFRKERELVHMAARRVDLGRDDYYPVREEELADAAIDSLCAWPEAPEPLASAPR